MGYKVPFYHIISRVYLSTWFLTYWFWAWSPGWQYIWFLSCKWLFKKVSLSLLYSLTGNHYVQPIFNPWEFYAPLLSEQNIYINYLELFHKGDLSPFPTFVFIQSFIYILVDTYFILWVISSTASFCYLNCPRIGHWELFQLALCPLNILPLT